jgi:hypothetical protein
MIPMRILTAAALCAALTPVPAFACASCGCTFTSDWLAQGLMTQPGQAVTIRYDYVPQTRLVTGTETIDPRNVLLPPEREIERRTDNHYLTLAYDKQFASDWGINVALPILWRPHRTIAEVTSSETRSNGKGIGDIRLVARWQGLSLPGSVTGLQVGLNLPTGPFHQSFSSGPGAGERVDRGLQPGTGTMQALVGAYHYRRLGSAVALIAQGQVHFALTSREAYRPGTFGEMSLSLQWLGLKLGSTTGRIIPEFQLNTRITARDSGGQADRENSGGEQVYLAPGMTAKLTPTLAVFGNVQVPLYQRVNGYQLVPRVIGATGLQVRF